MQDHLLGAGEQAAMLSCLGRRAAPRYGGREKSAWKVLLVAAFGPENVASIGRRLIGDQGRRPVLVGECRASRRSA